MGGRVTRDGRFDYSIQQRKSVAGHEVEEDRYDECLCSSDNAGQVKEPGGEEVAMAPKRTIPGIIETAG